jgi:Carboxypeptidase regulatory-like domain/TonB dependent receptor
MVAFAQDRASITGTVTDSSGALISGASVSLLAPSTQLQRDAKTNSNGIYSFTSLPVGSYRITIHSDHFKPLTVEGIDLSYEQVRTVDARLQVGAATEKVEVSASTEALNRTSAEQGITIEAPQIADIPLNGRNWATLMTLAPGAVNAGPGQQRDIRFNGHSLDDSNFSFDGIDVSGVQEQTQKADTRLNISLDSISEFRVSTTLYTAENGAAGGAQVNVVSKSGSNDWHGTLYDYLRNDKLDTRSPFDPSQIPAFRLNQFGAQLSGPVVKNKAFFFINYEGLRQSLGQTLTSFVPSASFRASVLAKSPALAPLINAYPTGQTFIDPDTDQLTVGVKNTVREDAGLFRFDYRFSDQSTAYVRYNIDNALIKSPQDALGTNNVIPVIPQNLVLQFQHIFSPSLVNETKFGLNRVNYHNTIVGTAPVNVSTSGFDPLNANSVDVEIGTTFSYIDNLTKILGRHTLKAGVEIRRIRLNNAGNSIRTSSISFSDNTQFINNTPDTIGELEGEGVRGNRRTFYMGYVQDEWKATPDLTLNLGLRYEFYSVAKEVLNRSAVVDIVGCGGYCPPGTPYYQPNYNDWGPRFGVAWTPAALGGKTVVRTGFGIYYGANQNDDFSDPLESAVPRYSISSSDNPGISYPINGFFTPSLALFSPKAIDRYRKDLSYLNWDFLVQQQLPGEFQAQAGYIGSSGRHLFDRYQVNLIDPATGQRPLSQFSQFGLKANDANNSFQALQFSLQRRLSSGLLWQTQYMWSHAIADGSFGAGESISFENQACRVCDRSDSSYDVRHTFTSNAIYQLPFGLGRRFLNTRNFAGQVLGGWELSGIATASSGLPLNITISRSRSALPDGNNSSQRPNLVPGVPIYPADQTINNWFNPAAFSTPAPGTWGTLGRNAGRGPGWYEIDLALQKAFALSERFRIDFRAEAFNLLNHPAYGIPASNISSGSFGIITNVLNTGAVGTGTPRRIQLMLRLNF